MDEEKTINEQKEVYTCPKCRDEKLSCSSEGRLGFADTPGKCARHPDIEMIKKEI